MSINVAPSPPSPGAVAVEFRYTQTDSFAALLRQLGASLLVSTYQANKLLVARPMDPHGKPEGNYLVAVDTVDAGVGETVLIVSGSSARMASGMKDCPVDAAVVGIVDTIQVRDTET